MNREAALRTWMQRGYPQKPKLEAVLLHLVVITDDVVGRGIWGDGFGGFSAV